MKRLLAVLGVLLISGCSIDPAALSGGGSTTSPTTATTRTTTVELPDVQAPDASTPAALPQTGTEPETPTGPAASAAPAGSALEALNTLEIKGRAPKTGYERSQFGEAWDDDNGALWGGDGLSTRENILSRDLTDITCRTRPGMPVTPPCVVQTGVLTDPYTGQVVNFRRGNDTSAEVPIDHVVALSDAWQKGAQQLTEAERLNFANDPLNLIATTRAPNSQKSDGDAATWLVPNVEFRCTYIARQVAVKARYGLWVTQAEHDAMARILDTCPGQPLPTEADAAARTA